jgi:hypothetical protein
MKLRKDATSRYRRNIKENILISYTSIKLPFGINKYDLELAKNFKHKIHLKDDLPIYWKQFKLPEEHNQFIEQTLDKWLKLGVVT